MPRDDGDDDDGDEYARGSIKSRIWTFTLLMAATVALWVEFQVLFWRQNDLPQSVHYRIKFRLLFHIEAANFSCRVLCAARCVQGSVALDTSANIPYLCFICPPTSLPPTSFSFISQEWFTCSVRVSHTHICVYADYSGPGICCKRGVRMDLWRWRQTAIIKTFFSSFRWGGGDFVLK